jgi:hypothetical protein
LLSTSAVASETTDQSGGGCRECAPLVHTFFQLFERRVIEDNVATDGLVPHNSHTELVAAREQLRKRVLASLDDALHRLPEIPASS